MNYLLQNATGNKTSWYANVTDYLYLANLPVALTRIVPFAGCENFSVWQGTGQDPPDESYWDTFQDGCVKLATAFVDACATGWEYVVSGQFFEDLCYVYSGEWMMGAAKAVGEKLNEIKVVVVEAVSGLLTYELECLKEKTLVLMEQFSLDLFTNSQSTSSASSFTNFCDNPNSTDAALAFVGTLPEIEKNLISFSKLVSAGAFVLLGITKICTFVKNTILNFFDPLIGKESSSYTPPSGSSYDSRDEDYDGIPVSVEGSANDSRTDLYIEVDWLQGWKPKTDQDLENEMKKLNLATDTLFVLFALEAAVGFAIALLLLTGNPVIAAAGSAVGVILAMLVTFALMKTMSWVSGYGHIKSAPLPFIKEYYKTKGITVHYTYDNALMDQNGNVLSSDTEVISVGEGTPRYNDPNNWAQIEETNHDDSKAVYLIFVHTYESLEDLGKTGGGSGSMVIWGHIDDLCEGSFSHGPASYYKTVTAIHELGHSLGIEVSAPGYGEVYCNDTKCFMSDLRPWWGAFGTYSYCDYHWGLHSLRGKHSVDGDKINDW